MTTMNGAAQVVAAADQVVFDARHGVVDNEALIYALPADQASAALPLYLRFKQAAAEKKEEVAQAQYDRLVHQQEKSDEELEKEHEHQQLMEYREAMHGLLKETAHETEELDRLIHADKQKHDEEDAIHGTDGREMVRSNDGKRWLYTNGSEVADKDQIDYANAQEKELEAHGRHAERIDEHNQRSEDWAAGQKISEDAKKTSAKNGSDEPDSEEERAKRLKEQQEIIEREKRIKERIAENSKAQDKAPQNLSKVTDDDTPAVPQIAANNNGAGVNGSVNSVVARAATPGPA